MLTYQETQEKIADDEERFIILGNGFSRACHDDLFKYPSIYESSDFGKRSAEIRSAFKALYTFDFEEVMGSLLSSAAILEIYASCLKDKISEIRLDAKNLKDVSLKTITSTHPSLPYDIPGREYRNTRDFIGEFKKIYTVNYDLLLYWARNQRNIDNAGYIGDDGFRNDKWTESNKSQSVFFLHGGLHIYQGSDGVKKHVYDNDGAIIDKVRDNLERGIFPLFVSEPTSESKLKKISKNPYLSHAYHSLNDICGTLYIIGHSMSKTDEHIFRKARGSDVTKIFVSIHGDPQAEENVCVMENAAGYFHGKQVEFFDASTVPIWKTAIAPDLP